MQQFKKVSILIFLIFFSITLKSQILISLLFGDALNSPKVEFGLSGGLNRSNVYSISNSAGMNNFDLGFYFHILMKNNSYLSTGVRVKSGVGATGMPTYKIDNGAFDSIYQDGILTKKIPAFYVPILFQQRFNGRWYIEAGPQLGLIYKAEDIFEENALDGNLRYERPVQDEYKHIDMGLLAGVGYKYSKEVKSVSYGVQYYYGLLNVSNRPDIKIKNSAVYFFVRIPIGV